MHEKIRRSGYLEFLYISLCIVMSKLRALVRIGFLRLRKYHFDYSVDLGSQTVIFQSKKGSIKVGQGTRIGFGVRLKAGFNGTITVGRNVWIDDYSFIYAHKDLVIKDGVRIASHVYIIDFDHKYSHATDKLEYGLEKAYSSSPITIGKNVWIGTHAVVLRGISIGDNSVIGAGAIVTKSIPANSVVVGNPAKVVKKIV